MNDTRLDSAFDTLRRATPEADATPSAHLIRTGNRRTTRRRAALGTVASVAAIAVITTTVLAVNGDNKPTITAASQTSASASQSTDPALKGTNNADPNEKAHPAPKLPALTPADFSQQQWKKTAKDYGMSVDHVAAGPGRLVFVGHGRSADGSTQGPEQIVGVDAATGVKKWSKQIPSSNGLVSSVSSTQATGPAVVITIERNNGKSDKLPTQIVARNAVDGSLRWDYPLGNVDEYSFANGGVAASGTTTVVRMGAQLWVFGSLAGDLRFSRKLDSPTNVTDAQVGSWAQATASQRWVAATARPDGGQDLLKVWDAQTGVEILTKTFGEPGISSQTVALGDQHVFLLKAGAPLSVLALPLTAGAREWSKPLQPTSSATLTYDAGSKAMVVSYNADSIYSKDGSAENVGGDIVTAFRADSGEQLWSRTGQQVSDKTEAAVNTETVEGADAGKLQVLDRASDKQLVQLTLPKDLAQRPDGTVDQQESNRQWEDTQLINYGAATVVVNSYGLQALVR